MKIKWYHIITIVLIVIIIIKITIIITIIITIASIIIIISIRGKSSSTIIINAKSTMEVMIMIDNNRINNDEVRNKVSINNDIPAALSTVVIIVKTTGYGNYHDSDDNDYMTFSKNNESNDSYHDMISRINTSMKKIRHWNVNDGNFYLLNISKCISNDYSGDDNDDN